MLLKHLIGLMRPDAGEIWIDGQNIIGLNERALAPIREKVGILFQGSALFDSMTVEENIAFPLKEAGERDPSVIREKVRHMLEVMELEGQEEKMPVNLSGGMKKRVGLARAIVRRPSCILYDEPTSGLDPVVSDSINRLIRRLQQRFGVTSVVVTHDMKKRVSRGRSHRLSARRADLFPRNTGRIAGLGRLGASGFPAWPFRGSGNPGGRSGVESWEVRVDSDRQWTGTSEAWNLKSGFLSLSDWRSWPP